MPFTKKSTLRETLRRVRDGLGHDPSLINLKWVFRDMVEKAGFPSERSEDLATYTTALAIVMHGIFAHLVTKPHEPDQLRTLVLSRTATWANKAGDLWQLGYNETQFMASCVFESVCESEGCSNAVV